MSDISHTIVAKSDQLNADDLIGKEAVDITVSRVSVGTGDQPINIYYGDDNRPYKPCLSMRRVLAHFWGSESDNWVGKKMTIYRDPSVKWAGQEYGGIRIKAMEGLSKAQTVSLQATKGKKVIYTVEPFVESAKPKPKAPPIISVIKAFKAAETVEVLKEKYQKSQTFDELMDDQEIEEAYVARLGELEGAQS
jgi:hypothetical protein